MKTTITLGVLMAVCCAPLAEATVINEGAAYAIADNFVDHEGTAGAPGEGSHFHASNVLPVDPTDSTIIAADVAEVGGLTDESIRGMVEFDLSGRPMAELVTLHFDVANLSEMGLSSDPVGGLFGQPKYVGGIDVVAYEGDGQEELSDYQAAPVASVGSFQTGDLSADDTTSFDITGIYNEQIEGGGSWLGIRLQVSEPDGIPDSAISFDNFRLAIVPEPSTLVLASLALLVLLGSGHRHR
jgi:hypothetical protein